MIPGIVAGQMRGGAVAGAYRDLILSHAPLGYWRLGETSGATAADLSGNGRNGTYSGTYALNQPSMIPSDTSNGALGCLGSGYVQIGTGSAFTLIGRTWLFSIRMSNLAAFSYLWHLGNYSQPGSQGLSVYINTDGTIGLEFYYESFRYVAFTGFVASLGVAYRLGLRFNSNTSVSLIVNGVVVDTKAASPELPAGAPGSLRLGSADNGSGAQSALRGDLDEFAIIPSLLTEPQLAALEAAATT